MGKNCETFRQRLANGGAMIGTFLKTPSPIAAEVLALSELDLICIDTEHAPFGRLELDLCVASLRAADMPSIVRTADHSAREIRNALDSGATGVLVPHVTSVEQAQAIARAAHFGEGGRGYAGSTRAAGFTGKSMSQHIGDSASQTTVIAQIEDLAALEQVAGIAAVDGIDAVFVGRADLAVAMGKNAMDADVIEAVRGVCTTAIAAGTTVGMFTPDNSEIPGWIAAGCRFFLQSSDQSMVLDGARRLRELVS